jgi:Fe-S-cluster-containing dehydrogenase component
VLRASEAAASMKASPLVLMEKAAGMLVGDPVLCVFCQRCELACTEFNDGKADPKLARIKIARNGMFGPGGALEDLSKGIYGRSALVIQDTCKQCPHPVPCASACPQNAIVAQPKTGTRVVDKEKCLGCRLCQRACPWGVMTFNEAQGKADKCFLCNGAPKCVEACPSSALRYVPWSDRTREAATRGSFMWSVPAERQAACNSCHVDSPGGPRNLKYEQ